MKSAFSKSIRLIAFLIAIVFTSETILQAAPLSASINTASASIPVPPFLSLPPVELAGELGKIEDVFPASANSKAPFIYLIQDAHDSLDAQESIRQILNTLVEKEKVSLVCFEGGSTELDNSFYNFTGNPKLNKQVWNALFAKGQIGGLERAALENNSGARFYGIEDEKVYFQNIHKIQKVFAGEDKSREVLERMDRVTSELAGRLLTGDVKKLRDLKRALETKRLNLMQYAKELVRKQEVDQKDWPQLSRLLKLQRFELTLEKNQESRQKELSVIARRSQDDDINFIWDSTQHARVKGRLRWYFEHWFDSHKTQASRLSPAVKDWIGFHVLQDEISARELFDEITRFEKQIMGQMKISPEAKEFLSREHDWTLIKKLISLSLTREEWREVMSLTQKNRYPELVRIIQLAKENYVIVEQRDQILSKRILERIESAKSGKVAVLTGGFHTDQLAAFLKEKNIGFAVISPAIQDVNRQLDYCGRMILGAEKKLKKSKADQTALAVAGSLGSPAAKPFKDHLKLEAEKVMNGSAGASLGSFSNARDISMRAKELSRIGQDRKAVDLLEGALAQAQNQKDGILWYQLAKSYRFLKNFPDALAAVRKAKLIKPHDDRILMLMAEILMGFEDDKSLAEASKIIEEAITMFPAIQSLTVKIQILTKQARTQEAVELAEQVKKKFPKDLRIYGMLSKLYLDVNRPDDAIRTVREGLKNDPEDVKGHAIEAELWRGRELDESDISKRIYFLEMAYQAIMRAVTLSPQHPTYLRTKRDIERDLWHVRKLGKKSISNSKDDALGASLGAEQALPQEAGSANIKYLRLITKFSPGKAAVLPGSIYDSLVAIAGPQALAMLLYEVFQAATGFSEKEKQYEAFNNQVWRFLSASDGQVLLNALNIFAEKQLKRSNVHLQLTDVREIVSALALPDNQRDLVTFAGMQILQSMIFVTLKTGERIQFYVQIRFTQETFKLADASSIREIPNPLLTSDEGVLDGEKRKFISPAFVTPEGALFRYGITGANAVGFLHVAGYSAADYKRAEEHSQLVHGAQAALFDALFWKPLESDESAKALILGVGHGRELIRPGVNQKAVDIPESLASRISVTDMMEGPLNEIKRRFPKITAIKSDWQKLSVPDGSADIVLGLNAISFVPKRELPGVIRELDRVLKFGKDGIKKMIFAVDIPPAQLRILTEIQDDGSLSKLNEKLDAVTFLPKWKEIMREAFLAQGYQVNFRTEIASAVVPQNAAHRKLDGRDGRGLNTFSFAYDRGIEAIFDRSSKPGEVKEVYKVLVVEAVKAQASSLGIVGDDEEGALDGEGWKPFSASNQAPDFEQSMEKLDVMDERAANMAEGGFWFEAYKIYLQMKKIRESWNMQIPAILILEIGIAQKNLRLLDQAEANLSEALQEIYLWDDSIKDKEFCLFQGLIHRGDLYTQMGRYDDAVRDFSYILALIRMEDLSKTVVYEQRAFAYLHLSRWEEARQDFAAVISNDEKEGDDTPIAIYLGLAAALNQLGLVREENRILKEASKFNPDQFSIDFYRALKLTNKRRFAEALRKLKGGLPKITGRERIYLHLLRGYAYAARKEYHRALKEFQSVVALDPIHVIAGKNIIQIQDWKKSRGIAKPVFAPLSIASPVWFSYFAVDAGVEEDDQDADRGGVDPVLILKDIEDLDHRIFEIEKILSTFAENRPRALLLLQADTWFDLNSKEKRATGKNKPMYLLQSMLAYKEVRDIDISIGKKTTTSFVEGRIEQIEKIIVERDYEGVANFSPSKSDDFDSAVIEKIEAIENPDRRLQQINLAFKEHGELPERMLLKASTLLEKFEEIKNPDKENIRLLAQAEEAFRALLREEPDNGFAQKGMARISEIKAKFLGDGDELGQGAVAKSLGENPDYARQIKNIRKFWLRTPSFADDFIHSEHHLNIDSEKMRAVISGRILASEKDIRTLADIGQQFQCTKEAISQIERKLVKKMTSYVRFKALRLLAAGGKKKEVLTRPVTDLNLGTRALGALQKISIETIGQLIGQTPNQLLSLPNFNETSLKEIVTQLQKIGLNLSRELTEQEKLDQTFGKLKLPAERNQKKKILSSPILELGLPERVIFILREIGKRKLKKDDLNIEDVLKFRRSDILTEFGAGKKTADLIVDRLSHLNLELALEPAKPSRLPAIDKFINMIGEGRKDEVLARPVVELVLGGKTAKVVERLSRIRFGKARQMTIAEFLDILENDPEIISMVRQGMPSVMEDLRLGKMRLLREALERTDASSLGANDELGDGDDGDPRLVEMENDLELYMRGNNHRKMLDQIAKIEDYLDDRGFKMQPVLYFNRGSIYQNMGRAERSIQPFTQAIELYKSMHRDEEMNEELWDCYRQRGVAHMDLKQRDAALQDFNEALKISKKDPDILHLRGLTYFMKSEWLKAIADLSEAVHAGDAPLRAYLALAYAYDMANMSHDRDRIEKKMAQKFPRSPKVNFVKALIRFEKKLSKGPLNYVNDAIEKQGDKERAAVYLLKGYISLNLKSWKEAEAAFRKARDLDPLNPEPRYQLAGILYRDSETNWEIANEELNEANFLARTSLNETALIRLFQDKKRSVRKATEFGLAYLLEEEDLVRIHPGVRQKLVDGFTGIMDLSGKQNRIELGMKTLGVTAPLLLLHAEILIQRFEAAKKLTGFESRDFLAAALKDYQNILELEPENVVAQDKLKKITEQMETIKNRKADDSSSAASLGTANFKTEYGASRESVEALIRITGFVGSLLRIHFPAAYAEMSSEFDPSKADKESFSHSVTTVVTKDYFLRNSNALLDVMQHDDQIFVLVKSREDHDRLKLFGKRVIPVEKLDLNSKLGSRENIFSLEFDTRDGMTVPPARKTMLRFKWDESLVTNGLSSRDAIAKLRRFLLVTDPKERKNLLEREGLSDIGGFWFINKGFLALIEKLTDSIQAEKSLQTAA